MAACWSALIGGSTTASAYSSGALGSDPTTVAPLTTVATTPEPKRPSINGTLVAGDRPVVGVKVTVMQGGVLIGAAMSDSAGKFAIVVPKPGAFVVAIDVATIPQGFALADPTRSSLPDYRVFGSFAQVVSFPFAGESSSAPNLEQQGDAIRFLQLVVGGIRFGLIVGVCAVGLSLIFGTTGLVNFAHGELVTFGALVAFFFNTNRGGPRVSLVFAGIFAVVVGGAFGGALQRGLWQPIEKRTSNAARMLVSIGLALFLRYLFQVVFTGNSRTYRQYSAQGPFKIGPIELPVRDYIVMVLCTVALLSVAFVLQRTRLGTAIRAVADEKELAAASGINVQRIVTYVWVAGAALSALGGVVLGVTESVQWNMGFRLLLTLFAAVVLGGLGSAYGAMAGGIAVGLATEVSTFWLPADYKIAVGLGVLVAVLLARPQGLLGIRERVG